MKEAAYLMLLALLVLSAAGTVAARNQLAAVVVLSVFSVATTVAFAFLHAVDVAMAEAVIGTGLTTALILAALSQTWRLR